MEREILFRAQRIDNNEWVYGYYYHQIIRDGFNPDKHILFEKYFIRLLEPGNSILEAVEVIPETVCQFTGMLDKNGTKIFESDIIKAPSGRSYVIIFTTWTHDEKRNKFLTDRYEFTGWCISKDGINPCDTLDSETLLGEKIGNIYDNSELLK